MPKEYKEKLQKNKTNKRQRSNRDSEWAQATVQISLDKISQRHYYDNSS